MKENARCNVEWKGQDGVDYERKARLQLALLLLELLDVLFVKRNPGFHLR
jgi:hypothetical protein